MVIALLIIAFIVGLITGVTYGYRNAEEKWASNIHNSNPLIAHINGRVNTYKVLLGAEYLKLRLNAKRPRTPSHD